MILTDREIQIALAQKQLSIDPSPDADAYSSTSVDLTLADTFAEWLDKPGMELSPGAPGYSYSNFLDLQSKQTAARFSLKPRHFVLAWTRESVVIPTQSRLAARVEGKSNLARLGIGVHVTAPIIHCGWKGAIQLEMCNFGPYTINLDAGMRICQLVFEITVGTPQMGYAGQFLGQAPSPKT